MSKEKRINQRWYELPFLYKIQIVSYFIAGICGAIAYPLTTKLIYSSVETDILASRLVLSSLIGITLSIMWLSIQERLYKLFVWFTSLECIAYTLLIFYVIIYQNYNSYLILSTIIGGTIGRIVSGASGKLHQQITDNEQYRTDYGFFISIVSCLGVLVGSTIATIFNLHIAFAFIMLLISLIGFEITDIYIYRKLTNKTYAEKISNT